MSSPGFNSHDGNISDNCPLVSILAEMLRSALQWEAASPVESESDSSLNQDATGIDCPPTGPKSKPAS